MAAETRSCNAFCSTVCGLVSHSVIFSARFCIFALLLFTELVKKKKKKLTSPEPYATVSNRKQDGGLINQSHRQILNNSFLWHILGEIVNETL